MSPCIFLAFFENLPGETAVKSGDSARSVTCELLNLQKTSEAAFIEYKYPNQRVCIFCHDLAYSVGMHDRRSADTYCGTDIETFTHVNRMRHNFWHRHPCQLHKQLISLLCISFCMRTITPQFSLHSSSDTPGVIHHRRYH